MTDPQDVRDIVTEPGSDMLPPEVPDRARITTVKQFLKMIADDWPKYATRPGRNEFSLEDLSRYSADKDQRDNRAGHGECCSYPHDPSKSMHERFINRATNRLLR